MQPKSDNAAAKAAKKAYAPPELTEYGDVSRLTQTGGISAKDHETAGSRKIGA